MPSNFDLSNLALKAAFPTNVIMVDDKGLPSVMVYVPKFNISDVIAGGSATTHPAFIVNGVEKPGIYISKYQNVVGSNGRAYSLPGEDPKASVTFDQAKAACELKGAGWHLMTNAEWALIALWCRKNSLMPKGNNNYGKDTTETEYLAIPTYMDGVNRARVATGSGPKTWSHNGDYNGIWDLNGNVYEWVGGYRTVAGEIQVIENNNAAVTGTDQSSMSTLWRAILEDGSLANPGTADTLKWDYTADPGTATGNKAFRLNNTLEFQQTVEAPNGGQSFSGLTAADGVTAPDILKVLGIYPADSGDHGGDYFYMRNLAGDERLLCRGGYWIGGASAGVFYGSGNYPRSYSSTTLGFRSAFVA